MMKRVSVLAAGVFLAAASVQAGERPMVDVECKPTDEDLVYHCMFNVMGKKSHKPLEEADFSVSADMPSMPMAHNVPPIKPKPVQDKPGMYQGMLELEMMGEWALKMEFKAPARDIVVKKLTFGKGDMKMDHSGHDMKDGDKKMDHSEHKSE